MVGADGNLLSSHFFCLRMSSLIPLRGGVARSAGVVKMRNLKNYFPLSIQPLPFPKTVTRGEDSCPKAKLVAPEAIRSIAGGSGERVPPSGALRGVPAEGVDAYWPKGQ